jgi:hypothetical protein
MYKGVDDKSYLFELKKVWIDWSLQIIQRCGCVCVCFIYIFGRRPTIIYHGFSLTK